MTEYCTPGATGFFQTCGQFAECQENMASLKYTCVHDSPFTPKAGIIITYIITPILVGIGILGGLGGGVLKGPLLEMILNYSQSEATHIAYCLMFGGTLLNTILLMFEKHPEDQARPIINYRVAIIFNLAVPLATNLGSSLATFMPQLYTLILQECFLFAVAPLLWKRAKQAKIDELTKPTETKESSAKLSQPQNGTRSIEMLHIESLNYSIPNSYQSPLQDSTSTVNSETLYYKFKQETENILPPFPILFILCSFGLNQIFIQMRSTSPKKPSYVGIEDCTWQNNFILLILVIVNLLFDFFVYKYGVRQEQQYNTINYLPNERYFTPISKFCIVYAGGFGAGFLSGFLGMGAGFVMVPVLLHCELIPRCSSATSAFIYFMISLNNLITLLTVDHLGWQTIVMFTGLAIIGGSVITKIGYVLLRKYKIGYTVILIVFSLDIANIISQIYYGIVTGERYGMQILTTANKQCGS